MNLSSSRVIISAIIVLSLGLSSCGSSQKTSKSSSKKKTARELLAALDKRPRYPARQVIEDQLSELGANDAPLLRSYVADKSKDGRSRFYVLRALFKNMPREKQIEEILLARAQHSGMVFRVLLTQEMGTMDHPPFMKLLEKTLTDPKEHASVQAMAAHTLASFGDARTKELGKKRALKLLLDGEGGRFLAMDTLVSLNANDVIPTLEDCARESTSLTKKNSCRIAKLRLQLKSATPSEKIKLLDAALGEDDFSSARFWAADRLISIGTSRAGKTLARHAKNKDSPGQMAALNGLSQGVKKGKWSQRKAKAWLAD